MIDAGDPSVFAIRYDNDGDVGFAYHNVSDGDRVVKAPDASELGSLYEVFSDSPYESPEVGASQLAINRFGYRWLRGRGDLDRDGCNGRAEMRKTLSAIES